MKTLLTFVLAIAIVGVAIVVYSQSKNINEKKYSLDSLYCQHDTDCVKQANGCTCSGSYTTVNKYHYKKLDCGLPKTNAPVYDCMGFTVGEPKCQNHQCVLATKK